MNPTRVDHSRRLPTTPVGFIPSRRKSHVKPVEEMNTVSELREVRKRVLQWSQTCDPAIRHRYENRLQEIDQRIQEVTSVQVMTTEFGKIHIDNFPGPSSTPSTVPGSPYANGNGSHSGGELQFRLAIPPPLGYNGPVSPTTHYSTMSPAKARIVAKMEQEPKVVSKHKPSRIQMMTAEDTVRMGRQEHEKEMERLERIQADRLAREKLRVNAAVQGISEEERRRRILMFMNYKGESDDEDDEADDDDEYEDNEGSDYFSGQPYGYLNGPGSPSYLERDSLGRGEDDMDIDLATIIKVDPKRCP